MSENSLEFQRALKDACDVQWGNWLYGGGLKKSSRRNVEKDLARIQEIKNSAEAKAEVARRKAEVIRRKVDDLRRQHDPMLKRITENFRMKNNLISSGPVCPKCGDSDMGNTMNGEPWCFKCRVVLVSPDKIQKWVDIRKGNMDDVIRRLRGLP